MYYIYCTYCLLFTFTFNHEGYEAALSSRCFNEWGGGLLKPPLRNQLWSWLSPHVAIDILLRYKSRDHMPNFGLLSRKLSEISRFQNLVKLRFHVALVYINCHNLLNFEATGLIFCMQA